MVHVAVISSNQFYSKLTAQACLSVKKICHPQGVPPLSFPGLLGGGFLRVGFLKGADVL